MWMIGCSDGSDLNSSNCNVRRLRPLIPRPATNPTSNSYFTLNQQNAEPLALFAQLGNARDKAACFGTQPGQLVSSRWNPTPKQLETLVDIYKQGTRNPTADQIQHITYQLRKFGKIEGKNVFYWFQNHKARERQKRRRRIEAGERELVESSDKQLSESHAQGTSSSGFPTKSTISAKEFVSVSRSTPESARDRQDHLSQCDNPAHEQDQQGHATWKLVHSSAPRYHHFSNVVSPSTSTTDHLKQVSDKYNAAMDEDKLGELQTLELFPLHSDHKVHDEKESHVGATIPTSLGSTPFQFFHFLPLKN